MNWKKKKETFFGARASAPFICGQLGSGWPPLRKRISDHFQKWRHLNLNMHRVHEKKEGTKPPKIVGRKASDVLFCRAVLATEKGQSESLQRPSSGPLLAVIVQLNAGQKKKKMPIHRATERSRSHSCDLFFCLGPGGKHGK